MNIIMLEHAPLFSLSFGGDDKSLDAESTVFVGENNWDADWEFCKNVGNVDWLYDNGDDCRGLFDNLLTSIWLLFNWLVILKFSHS